MASLMNRPPTADESEHADGLKIKLAAARCLIDDLKQTKKQHEGVIDSLSMVRTGDARHGCHVQLHK